MGMPWKKGACVACLLTGVDRIECRADVETVVGAEVNASSL